MGLDDMLKQQIRARAPELKRKLVDEFSELTHKRHGRVKRRSGRDRRPHSEQDRPAAGPGRAARHAGDATRLTPAVGSLLPAIALTSRASWMTSYGTTLRVTPRTEEGGIDGN